MLPFVVAAGHHNYIYSLPMCLKEMNNLKNPAPYVYQYFTKGQYYVQKKLSHSLEDGGELIRYRLEDGFHTFGTSIFDGAAFTRTFTMVYKLRVASKCPCNCSCAKCLVPRCAACKCKRNDTKCRRVIPVRTLVENNGCDKSDTGDSGQSLRCD